MWDSEAKKKKKRKQFFKWQQVSALIKHEFSKQLWENIENSVSQATRP